MFDQELTTLLKTALTQYITPPLTIDPHVLAYRFDDGKLSPMAIHFNLTLDDLLGIDTQKEKLIKNTQAFLKNLPANHCLMTGARGVGKSSLIKALLNAYHKDGLRIIEIGREDLYYLPKISQAIKSDNQYKYIVFCDDLAFNHQDESYRSLKSVLDGSLDNKDNLLIYATSNRRHLLPQLMKDNVNIYNGQTDEVNPYEHIDETVSLSDRFGLWLSFYPLTQEEYLNIVKHYLKKADIEFNEEIKTEALRWTTQRGNKSGRLAQQFCKDFIGRYLLSI
ncbi:MAG: ATP-binding protein [Moraxella sp.]|nr:ATP-binding protein [Moraxella sp.]